MSARIRSFAVMTVALFTAGSFVACEKSDNKISSNSTQLTPEQTQAVAAEARRSSKLLALVEEASIQSKGIGEYLRRQGEVVGHESYGTFDFLRDAAHALSIRKAERNGDYIYRRAELQLAGSGLSDECSKVQIEMRTLSKVAAVKSESKSAAKSDENSEENPRTPKVDGKSKDGDIDESSQKSDSDLSAETSKEASESEHRQVAGAVAAKSRGTAAKDESVDDSSDKASDDEDAKAKANAEVESKVTSSLGKLDSELQQSEDAAARSEIRVKTCATGVTADDAAAAPADANYTRVVIFKATPHGYAMRVDLSAFPELTGIDSVPLNSLLKERKLMMKCALDRSANAALVRIHCKEALFATIDHTIRARFERKLGGASSLEAEAGIYDHTEQKKKLVVRASAGQVAEVVLKEVNSDGTEKAPSKADTEKSSDKVK